MCWEQFAAAVAGQAVSKLFGGGDKQQAAAPAPSVLTAPPQSQAAKTPAQSVFKGGLAGVDPTALTGPGGVSNDSLTLGKSTVLGS